MKKSEIDYEDEDKEVGTLTPDENQQMLDDIGWSVSVFLQQQYGEKIYNGVSGIQEACDEVRVALVRLNAVYELFQAEFNRRHYSQVLERTLKSGSKNRNRKGFNR